MLSFRLAMKHRLHQGGYISIWHVFDAAYRRNDMSAYPHYMISIYYIQVDEFLASQIAALDFGAFCSCFTEYISYCDTIQCLRV